MEATPGEWEDLMGYSTLTDPYERMVKKLAQLIVKRHPVRGICSSAHATTREPGSQSSWLEPLKRMRCLPADGSGTACMQEGIVPERYRHVLGEGASTGSNEQKPCDFRMKRQ